MNTLRLYLILQLLAVAGFAQKVTTLSGTVVDAASHPVAAATVHLLNTNYASVTGSDGHFTINNVVSGTYTLLVSAVGTGQSTQQVVLKNAAEMVTIIVANTAGLLDEVVVTAQKSEELRQQVPVSITSLSGRTVEDYRLWNSKEITAIVPNLYAADPGDKRNVISLRGIATTSYDPAVGTYIDGVNQFNLDTYIAQLFDVERIEILRGPQGTLYGRNAMAGVINIITKQPGNKAGAFGEISYGNHGLQRYSAGYRAPLVKNKLFFGIAGLYERSNGFYTNEPDNSHFDKQNSFTGNYYLKYLPVQNLSLTLNVKHNNNRNNGTFPLVNGVEDALNNPFKLSQNAVTKLVDNTFNSSLSLNYSGRLFNFSSQTAYQSNYRYYKDPIDGDFSPIDGVTLINNYGKDWNKVKVVTQEFKFSSPASSGGNFKWTAGSYLFHQDNPVKQATRFGNDAIYIDSNAQANSSLINTTKAKSNGYAFFGQAAYSFNKRFTITGGIRYDHETKEQSVLGQYQADPDPVPVFDYRSDTSAKATFHAVSPKVTLDFKMTSDNLVYLSYSKGYRAGGLTPLSPDPSQPALFIYKPEYSSNYEAGFKNTFLNKQLLLNITAFYSHITDAQVPTLVLPGAVTITRNTGKLNSKGVELETSGLFGGFQFDYNFGYTDAHFDNLKIAQNGHEVDLKGKNQLFSPNVTSVLAVRYGFLLSKKQQLKLTIRGEWKYIGRQYFDLANSISQAGYNLFNARAEIALPKFSLALWARNLANKKYISYAYDFGAVHLGDPVTYGVTAGVRL